MEPVSIALGGAAVKWIARLWLGSAIPEGIGDNVLDALTGRVSTKFEQRALKRQLEEMADNIADRLEPFLSAEIPGITENDRTAAARAAQDSLETSHALDSSTVVATNMDAELLARHIRQHDGGAVSRAGLGEAGAQLYDTLLTECASYIVSIAQSLPGYATASAAEMLGRTSKLIDLSNQVLNSMPSSSVPNEWGPGSEDQRFENKYRKAVSEYSSHLQLYGVTSATARSSYPLSVAYISLSVDVGPVTKPNDSVEPSDGDDEWSDDSGDLGIDGTHRIDALLDGSDYLLLTGNAGSGKTTLVQWLATSALTSISAQDRAISKWQGRVPFVIPLRRYIAATLPTPEHFVATIAPNLAGAMPNSWVHRTLASGRGMLLIDGLDELPSDRRDEVREWVLSLINDFPSSKVLVTSRTTAITRGWKEADKFQRATLLPMEFGDIRSFINHWHEAASMGTLTSTSDQISTAKKSLLQIVRDRPAIRSICTSPLLCALICALHLEGGANLPNNRMDVYKTALEMLVVRRDSDRNADHIGDVELGYREREILLRSFALWMHENGASDATTNEYHRRIAKSLSTLYRVKTPPLAVANYLLERSGILREPIPGRVDFVHRTFLEYLAAAHVVDDDSIDKLIRQAHDDHWREVIIMAAGHANSQQRVALLSGLLDRGERETANRPRLYMLAVACMETSPEITAELVTRLGAALEAVLPPRNMTEAAAVASAGTLAVHRLKANGQGAVVAAACVRALSLIGGEEALAALSTYSLDDRVTVTRQLIKAWSGFDTEKYAETVLKKSRLDNGRILITDSEQLAQLAILENANSVEVKISDGSIDFGAIPDSNAGIRTLELGDATRLHSIRQLPPLPNLVRLSLRATTIHDLDGIERYAQLQAMHLGQNGSLRDVSAISSLKNLRMVDLSETLLSDLAPFSGEMGLKALRILGAPQLTTIDTPVAAKALVLSFTPKLRDVSGLSISDELDTLIMDGHSEHLRRIVLPTSLRVLALRALRSSKITDISGAEQLEELSISDMPNEAIVNWIESLPSLTHLSWVYFMRRASDATLSSVVQRLFLAPHLTSLTLWTDNDLPDIPGLTLSRSAYEAIYARE